LPAASLSRAETSTWPRSKLVRLGSPEWRAHALSGLADAQYLDCRVARALELFRNASS
jgi:hypothetical protein